MRLKKTLYAVVMLLAVASMVLPSVHAGRRVPRNYAFDRGFKAKYQGQINDDLTPRSIHGPKNGDQKPFLNYGLVKNGNTLDKLVENKSIAPVVNISTGEGVGVPANKRAINDASLGTAARASESIRLTPDQRMRLNLRGPNPVTETAAERKAKLEHAYAEAKKGLTRGGASTSAVLPQTEIADGSSLSAVALVGIAGTEDFFDLAVLLGDVDGTRNMESDFGSSTSTNVRRTMVDSASTVVQGILLPDEVYTDLAISGHTEANGAQDFNVFYTGTNGGFLSIEADSVCDGDLLADTNLGVVALTSLVVNGFPLSPSASITGIAVETDAEYDGDPASDEIVYFSVTDPEFGTNPTSAGLLFAMLDTDGDDIPDPAGVVAVGVSTRLSTGGVAVDSFGAVFWHQTDLVQGFILKRWDIDEDRVPFDAGGSSPFFALYEFADTITTTAALNAQRAELANAVDLTMDKNDNLYIACPNSTELGTPVNTGLPDVIISYSDRCGDVDPITGLIPRGNNFSDQPFRIFAASTDVAQTAGAGTGTAPLVLPGMQIDYSGYAGIATDFDDNIYIAVGAAPAGQSGDPSPFLGAILRIPDLNCDRIGDSVDMDGDGVFGEGGTEANVLLFDDYRWANAPINPPELTPNGIDSIDFGPLYSLNRQLDPFVNTAMIEDRGRGFAFDYFDGDVNNIAGGRTDLLFPTGCDNVGSNANGGVSGFEFLFCNTAFTGFRMGSNGLLVFRNDPTVSPALEVWRDFTPTVTEFLSFDAPVIAPFYTDLSPNFGFQFSVHRVGFAATDAFIIQYISMPEFGFGGVFVGLDPIFGLPTRGQINSFDITLYDDQDAWDDVEGEVTQDDTDLADVNDDNDGSSFPAGIGLHEVANHPTNGTQIIDRNNDGDITDENIANANQEGVGRTKPEQGPFKVVYHTIEAVGAGDGTGQPVVVGFMTGFDGVFNTGTIPPGLCETNLSNATPSPDDPFFMNGCIGMGTEPALYEFFDDGSYGFVRSDGTISAPFVDVDLRADYIDACLPRPELVNPDPNTECICFKGSNQPVGLFCQVLEVPEGNDDPFLGPVTYQIDGFCFPMPTTGQNAICPQFCGQTAPLCRPGKSVTYVTVFKFDEDGDGDTDATVTVEDPDLNVVSENFIQFTVDFSQTELCGGFVQICTFANYGFGDDNKYFEIQGAGVVPVQLVCIGDFIIGPRAPVVLSIAPDEVLCDNPDDPDNVEDVQIAGLCFFGSITSAFLTTNPDGTGTRVDMSNVVNVQSNICTATIPIAQLTPDTPYYVFVVRGTDGARSTNYPNAFGFDVTFLCTTEPVTPPTPITLTNCKVARVSGGKFSLRVNGTNFTPGDTIILLNGQPCRKNKYPARFINPSNGTTTRINCQGGLKALLPAVVTARNQSTGQVSTNSLNCDF